MQRTTIDRTLFATLAATTFATIATTTITLDLWVLSATAANAFAALYIVVVAALAIDPDRIALHHAALPMGALFWFGRAAAALERLYHGGAMALWTVVAQAAAIGVLATGVHLLSVRAAAAVTALQAPNGPR